MGTTIDLIDRGKLIDTLNNTFQSISDINSIIIEQPTVEAITKADYENRLKADLAAMLTDMLIDVEEIASREQWCDYANDNCISRYDVEDLFQQKISSLKEA